MRGHTHPRVIGGLVATFADPASPATASLRHCATGRRFCLRAKSSLEPPACECALSEAAGPGTSAHPHPSSNRNSKSTSASIPGALRAVNRWRRSTPPVIDPGPTASASLHAARQTSTRQTTRRRCQRRQLFKPRALFVESSRVPLAVRPFLVWKSRTAFCVLGP